MAVCALFWFGVVIAIIGVILAIIGSIFSTANQTDVQGWMQLLFWGGIILLALGLILIFIDLFRSPPETRCDLSVETRCI